MKVKLKDSIISELKCLGLRPGDIVSGTISSKITQSFDFTHYYNGSPYGCVVWPEDYEVVEAEIIPEIPANDITSDISLPISEVTNALDAMHWCFAPFLGNSDISESPWIINLIKSYNSIVSTLPLTWQLQYETVDY